MYLNLGLSIVHIYLNMAFIFSTNIILFQFKHTWSKICNADCWKNITKEINQYLTIYG
jgi:hypothetical protein